MAEKHFMAKNPFAVLFAVVILLWLPSIPQAQAPLPNAWTFPSMVEAFFPAFSPDGKLLAVAGEGTVQIYTASSLQPFRGVNTSIESISSMAFSPDGKTLALAGQKQTPGGWVEFWNMSTGLLTATFETTQTGINAIKFSPDGKTLALAGDNSATQLLQLWRVASHKLTASLKTTLTGITSVAFSADGKLLAAGGANATGGMVEIWDVSNGVLSKTLTSKATVVGSVAFSADGHYLAEAGNIAHEESIEADVWSLPAGNLEWNVPSTEESFVGLGFTQDSKTLVLGGSTMYYVWAGQNVLTFWGPEIESWSMTDNSLINRSSGESGAFGFAISADGQTVATCGVSYIINSAFITGVYGTLTTWATDTLSTTAGVTTGSTGSDWPGQVLPSPGYGAPVFSPDGKQVIGGGLSPGAVWSAMNGEWLGQLFSNLPGVASAYAYAPNRKNIAVAYSGTTASIQLFDAADLTATTSISTKASWVSCLKFSPDGSILAIGGQSSTGSGVIQLFEISSGNPLMSLHTAASAIYGLDFSSDGKSLASAGAGTTNALVTPKGVVELWDVSTGDLKTALNTEAQAALDVKFSPKNTLLAVCGGGSPAWTAGQSPVLELWTVATNKLEAGLPLAFGTSNVGSVAFTPNGSELFASSNVGVQEFSVSAHTLLGYGGTGCNYVALSPDGTKLANDSEDDGLEIAPVSGLASYAIDSLVLKPSLINMGSTATGTVTLKSPAPAGGVFIQLYGAVTNFSMPSVVVVPAGTKSVTFTMDATSAQGPSYLITAVSGRFAKSALLTVHSATVGSVVLSTTTVVGGTSLTGTVSINEPAPSGGAVVSLGAANSWVQVTPSTVTIPPGMQTASFNVTTSAVTTNESTFVEASWNGSFAYDWITLTPAATGQASARRDSPPPALKRRSWPASWLRGLANQGDFAHILH